MISINRLNVSVKKFMIFLLILSFLIPLIGLFSTSICDKTSVNDCLIKNNRGFTDFFYQYNTIRYIYQHHGNFPSGYLNIEFLDNFDGTPTEGYKRVIYHAPLYYYYATFLYLIAKMINVSDLFLIYFGSLVLFFFTNLFFFFNINRISKYVYKRTNNTFIIYSSILFLFLPVHLFLSLGIQQDIPIYFLFMVALFYYFKLTETKQFKHAFILGLVLGAGLLTNIAGLIIIAGFFYQMIYWHFKNNKITRNHLFWSLFISIVTGSYSFIRNMILFKHPVGDLITLGGQKVHNNIFFTFFRVFKAYWGGIFGGNAHIKLVLTLFIIILCICVILGSVFYFRKYKNDYMTILLMIGLSVFITSFLFMCNIPYLLEHGICKGDTIQSRYLYPLNCLTAIFASIFLVKIKNSIKNKTLKILPNIFVGIIALLFIIDFLTAIIYT